MESVGREGGREGTAPGHHAKWPNGGGGRRRPRGGCPLRPPGTMIYIISAEAGSDRPLGRWMACVCPSLVTCVCPPSSLLGRRKWSRRPRGLEGPSHRLRIGGRPKGRRAPPWTTLCPVAEISTGLCLRCLDSVLRLRCETHPCPIFSQDISSFLTRVLSLSSYPSLSIFFLSLPLLFLFCSPKPIASSSVHLLPPSPSAGLMRSLAPYSSASFLCPTTKVGYNCAVEF